MGRASARSAKALGISGIRAMDRWTDIPTTAMRAKAREIAVPATALASGDAEQAALLRSAGQNLGVRLKPLFNSNLQCTLALPWTSNNPRSLDGGLQKERNPYEKCRQKNKV